MTPTLTQAVYLGRHVPDRTPLEQPVFCALPGGAGLVTLPFVVYGQERARRIKPGYFIGLDGTLTRRVLAGLEPDATVFAYDDRGLYLAWSTPNHKDVVAVDDAGRTLWRHRLNGYGCARKVGPGPIAVGSVVGELRRLDRTGVLQHDLDSIFSGRPFSGPHGVDLVGPTTYLADPDVTHSVWAIDTMGNPVARLGSDDVAANRAGTGILYYPFDVVVLANGQIWAAEHGRRRLAGFDAGGSLIGHVVADDLGAEELCASRLFTDLERSAIAVFARRQREVWLLKWTPR